MTGVRPPSLGVEDRVAVVTGGSSGIGLATARTLLAAGARVAICGRDGARLDAALGELGGVAAPDRVLGAAPGESWAAWTERLARARHIPLARPGRPGEAAHAIAFLASPLASYTTGSFIDVPGGHSRHV